MCPMVGACCDAMGACLSIVLQLVDILREAALSGSLWILVPSDV